MVFSILFIAVTGFHLEARRQLQIRVQLHNISCDQLHLAATISYLCIPADFLVVYYTALYLLKRILDILYRPQELTNFVANLCTLVTYNSQAECSY